MRIELPDNEDPVMYTMLKAGSPRLLRSRLDSWDAQYFNESRITPREREVMRMRMALQMSCTLCADLRMNRDVSKLEPLLGVSHDTFSEEEIPEELYANVMQYATWPGYTDRERLAIEFGERFMLDYQDMAFDDGFWSRLKGCFSEEEICDLCLLAGMWDSSAKIFHLLIGIEAGCEIQPKNTMDGSGE